VKAYNIHADIVNLVHSHSIDIPLGFITEIVTTGLPPRSAEPKKIRLTKMTPLDMMEIPNLGIAA